jgi:hypothetical protein
VKLGDRYLPGANSHMADIYFGQNPDGSQRYIRQGKFAGDAFSMLSDPIATLGSKLSLPVRAIFEQIGKTEPGSGYQVINPKLTDEQQAQQRIAALANIVTPFSAQELVQSLEHSASPEVFREPGATSQFRGMPARRGASFSSSVQALRQAREANRADLAAQVLRNAQINGIDPKAIEKELNRRLRAEALTAAGIPKTEPPPAPVGR